MKPPSVTPAAAICVPFRIFRAAVDRFIVDPLSSPPSIRKMVYQPSPYPGFPAHGNFSPASLEAH